MSHEETVEIIEELLKSVKTRGLKKTLGLLKTSGNTQADLNDPFDSFVVNEILQEFNMTYDELFFSRYIRGERKYVLGLCVHFLYNKRTLGEIRRSIVPTKTKQLLGRYRQIVLELDGKNPQHAKYVQFMAEMDKKIEKFLKSKK